MTAYGPAFRQVRHFGAARMLSVKPTRLRLDPPEGLSLPEHIEGAAHVFPCHAPGGEAP